MPEQAKTIDNVLDDNKNDYETNEDHFRMYRESINRFMDLFGLKDWSVSFCYCENISAQAQCATNMQGRTVCFNFGKHWRYEEPTPERIDLTAFHEVMELMTSEYDAIIQDTDLSRQAKAEWRERADHTLIRRLENVVYPLIKRKQPDVQQEVIKEHLKVWADMTEK